MADTKITGLTDLAGVQAAGDLLEIVDVSDTTMNATGTNKKSTLTDFFANIPVAVDAGTNDITTGGQFTIDVDGTAVGSAGAIKLGASGDMGLWWTSGGVATVGATTALTNSVQDFALDHQTSGTPASGIGAGLIFQIETAAGNTEIGAAIRAVTTDVDPTNEDVDLVFYTMLSGDTATEVLRLHDDNAATFAGTIAAGATTVDGAAGGILLLTTQDTDVQSGDVLGRIDFQAPDEASGTDAIVIGAIIRAVATSTFAADNNKTALAFLTAASGAATEKMRLSEVGFLGLSTLGNNIDALLHLEVNDATAFQVKIEQNGGAGDPAILFEVQGARDWTIGIDNSVAGDPFNISMSAALETSIAVSIDNSQNWDFQANNLTTTGTLAADITTLTTDAAAASDVVDVLKLIRTSSDAPAADVGVGIQFITETGAGNNEIGGRIESVATDVDPTNEDFDLVFYTMLSGDTAAEWLRGASDLSATFAGTTTSTGNLIKAGTLGAATNIKTVTSSEDVSSSGNTHTVSSFIPDGALLLGLTVRVTTAVEGCTSFQIGNEGAADADLWGNGISINVNTTTTAADYTSIEAAGILYIAAEDVVFTAVGGAADFSAGVIRITAFYIDVTAHTS